MAQGEKLRQIHDAHIRALQARKGRTITQHNDDEMVKSTEAARRLCISLQTFYDRMRDQSLKASIKAEAVTGQGGQGGKVWLWRWGDIRAQKARFQPAATRRPGGPGWIPEEERIPLSPQYTGRPSLAPPLAKRVAVVDLPRVALWSIYEVRKGQRVPNRAAELEPGLWATDGARLIPCPWGLDELQRVFVEHDPAPDGARFFTTYKEGTSARQLED